MSNFQPIDIPTWPMTQAFYYYTKMASTSYTVNVNMDVTILRKELKECGYKFFPVNPQSKGFAQYENRPGSYSAGAAALSLIYNHSGY